MPIEAAHIGVANDNQATLAVLLTDINNHLPWVGTIAFYKALHVVEAVLATEFGTHQTTHTGRLHFLASENRLKKLYEHYCPLYTMSQKARYLSHCNNQGNVRFADHIRQPANG